MTHNNEIQEILDALATQKQRGETSLIVQLAPNLIPDALTALKAYRKVFAAVIPGLTDTARIHAAYEEMRQADETAPSILLLVECQSTQQFRDALDTLPPSSEWRSLPN